MAAGASFDDFVRAQSAKNRAVLRTLRELVARVRPGLAETVKWGNGCWVGEGGPVAYAHCDTDHVQFGFFRGASLDDPRGLLQGKGRYVRHAKVRTPADIDAGAFAALLEQADRAP